ncbi:MAG: peptide chain release factor 2 [Myxococcota bacterium]|nr:peptide chain release factor 2 [Myxococcota bacterium]
MRESKDRLRTLEARAHELRRHLDLDSRRARLEELERLSADPALWQDRDRAQKLLREKRGLERDLAYEAATQELESDAAVLLELAEQERDDETAREAIERLDELEARLEESELRRMLSGDQDGLGAIVSINAGAGGTEACDWAEMLYRMYLRWCERRGYAVQEIDLQEGEEAGIKNITFTVEGEYAIGYLRSENGIHRLVRISPFDAQKRRHTSFASFLAIPAIGDDIEVEIDEKDLRIDTFRAGGAGGQHVNRTDSAVRITHNPTGIVVQCQNERSQHKNKATAMKVLKSRLFDLATEEHRAEIENLAGEKKQIGFGSQIRSYTLHPSQRVKDHRTGTEIGNAQRVLDGDLDPLIRSYLLQSAEN